jgi:hypothetical protein
MLHDTKICFSKGFISCSKPKLNCNFSFVATSWEYFIHLKTAGIIRSVWTKLPGNLGSIAGRRKNPQHWTCHRGSLRQWVLEFWGHTRVWNTPLRSKTARCTSNPLGPLSIYSGVLSCDYQNPRINSIIRLVFEDAVCFLCYRAYRDCFNYLPKIRASRLG